MNYKAFCDFWNEMLRSFGRPPLDTDGLALQMEYEALKAYTVPQLLRAVIAHKQNRRDGKFAPTAAHLIDAIEGQPAYTVIEGNGAAYSPAPALPEHKPTPEESRAARERARAMIAPLLNRSATPKAARPIDTEPERSLRREPEELRHIEEQKRRARRLLESEAA